MSRKIIKSISHDVLKFEKNTNQESGKTIFDGTGFLDIQKSRGLFVEQFNQITHTTESNTKKTTHRSQSNGILQKAVLES